MARDALRPRLADRARREPRRDRRVHRRRAGAAALSLPGRALGVQRLPHRQDRLLPGRLRRALRAVRRAAPSTSRSRATCGSTLHGAADINLRDSSAYVEGPLADGWRASFAVRRSYIDAILPFVIKPKIGSTLRDLRARLLGLPGARRQGPRAAAASPRRLRQRRLAQRDRPGPDARADLRHAHRVPPPHGRVDHDASRAGAPALAADLRLRRPELRQRLGHQRLPALPPPLRARGSRRAGRCRRSRWPPASTPSSLTTGPTINVELPREGRTLGLTDARATEHRALALRHRARGSTSRRSGTDAAAARRPGLRFDYYHVVDTDKTSLDPRLSARWR